jgi:predicted RNase H-like nuclease (RuvC/YqgF family)
VERCILRCIRRRPQITRRLGKVRGPLRCPRCVLAVSLDGNKVRKDREDEVCAIADQAARIEAEARTIAAARAEVEQVHTDMRVLAGTRSELMERLRVLREQLGRTQSESAKAENVRTQIETMRREIQKGRYYPSL